MLNSRQESTFHGNQDKNIRPCLLLSMSNLDNTLSEIMFQKTTKDKFSLIKIKKEKNRKNRGSLGGRGRDPQ